MSIQLSDGRLWSLSDALKADRNVLSRLRRTSCQSDLYDLLWSQRAVVEALCAQHLGLRPSQCSVESKTTWKRGQFNICVMVQVKEAAESSYRMVFRCPMPHKVAEANTPGRMDEKIRVEVANYAFVESSCRGILVPKVAGFGLSDGKHFTHRSRLPWLAKLSSDITKTCQAALYTKIQSPYVSSRSNNELGIPYILLEYIDSDRGRLLSDTWFQYRDDRRRRHNLLLGLCRLVLSLARIPQPRIGCLRLNDDGFMTLAHPPLLCANLILENEGAPSVLKDLPTSSGPFLNSLLRFRREAFRAQPNAAQSEEDCRTQMAHLTLLEMLIPRLVDTEYKGPFYLQYTDLHASNLFVDDDWNIKWVIDLEFVCSLPPGMLSVPHWLTVDHIDELTDHMEEHRQHREEFLQILEQEERRATSRLHPTPSRSIRDAWDSGAVWIYRCFTSVDALSGIVEDHLWRRFGFDPKYSEYKSFVESLSHFWGENSETFVQRKISEKTRYDEDLRTSYSIKLRSSS